MRETTEKTYSNGEITIVWKPDSCIHSTVCWKKTTGLPTVFDPRSKPWIKPYGAGSAEIVAQVSKCPSGALSYFRNDGNQKENNSGETVRIEVTPKGPLIVRGDIIVKLRDGSVEEKGKTTAFCRCGKSANKPYCDGSHNQHEFE